MAINFKADGLKRESGLEGGASLICCALQSAGLQMEAAADFSKQW